MNRRTAVLDSIPEPSLSRLPGYLRCLDELRDEGLETVSSKELAVLSGVSHHSVRRDLLHVGASGVRGIGYEVGQLRFELSRVLGVTDAWRVAVLGAGNLGQALINYRGFSERGFEVVAAFDSDPRKIGTTVADVPVYAMSELPSVAKRSSIRMAVVATPAGAAQTVAEQAVAAGITSLLNFAPVLLRLPPSVSERRVDLAREMQVLAYHEARRAEPPARRGLEHRH